jgi:uncharacterized membrane protein
VIAPRATSRTTVAVLRAGAVIAGIGFIVGLVLALVKGGATTGPVAIGDVVPGLLRLDAPAWLTAASIVLICTPAAALVTSAVESWGTDRRSVAVCGLLLLIFAGSVFVATRT